MRWLALAWLFVGLPIAHVIGPAFNDFSQFYYGSLVVREHAWDALYAIPATADVSPGTDENAVMKPQQKELLGRLFRRSQIKFWFIQPPTAAVMLWPLSFFNPIPAHWAWLVVILSCMWIVARQAERIAELCFGGTSNLTRLIAPLLVITPLSYHVIRVSNISPIIAALIGWGVIELVRNRPLAGLPIAIGTLLKYATAPLGVVALCLGRWKAVLMSIVIATAITAATFAIAGREVFHEFATVIAPSLKYCPAGEENLSLEAFLARVTNPSLPAAVAKVSPQVKIVLRVAQLIIAAIMVWLTVRSRAKIASSAVLIAAACAAWIAWLILFSPIFWDHYLPYIYPFIGWAIWEARRDRVRLIVVIAIIAMTMFPTPFSVFKFPEPVNSHQMFALMLMLGLAIARLRRA